MAAGGGEDVLFDALASLIEGLPPSGSGETAAAEPPAEQPFAGGGLAAGSAAREEAAGYDRQCAPTVPCLPPQPAPSVAGARAPAAVGTLAPCIGTPPALGAAAAAFDARGAARRCLAEVRRARTTAGRLGPPPRDRRLVWLRWLGAVRGASPREWLAEVRAQREDFVRLLERLEKRVATDQALQQLRADIELDVGRCFPEVPCLQTEEAQAALSQVLLAYSERQSELAGETRGAYRQGLHELAAAFLVICWRGSWPALPAALDAAGLGLRHGGEVIRTPAPALGEAFEDEDDLAVYAELASPEAAPADALAMLDALLYGRRLAEMYDTAAAPAETSAAAARCQHIISGLCRLDPILAARITGWGIEPHVLMLRWMRLLFLRELPFAEALGLWDVLFADAAATVGSSCPMLPTGAAATASSVALPLADTLAIAMLLNTRPSSPAHLMRFDEVRADWRRLLSAAMDLRERGAASDGGQQQEAPRARPAAAGPGGGKFPLPPRARYDGPASLLMEPGGERALGAATADRTKQALKVASAGVNACGQALGWAGAALNYAMQDVLTVVADGGYGGQQGVHGCFGPLQRQGGGAEMAGGEEEEEAGEASDEPPEEPKELAPQRGLAAPGAAAARAAAEAPEGRGEAASGGAAEAPEAPVPAPPWDPRAPFPAGAPAAGEAPALSAVAVESPPTVGQLPIPSVFDPPPAPAAKRKAVRVVRRSPEAPPSRQPELEPDLFRPAPEGLRGFPPQGPEPDESAVDLKGVGRLAGASRPDPLLPPGSYEGAVDVKALAGMGLPWPGGGVAAAGAPGWAAGLPPPPLPPFGPPSQSTVSQQLAGAIGSIQRGEAPDAALLEQLREARAQLLAAASTGAPPMGVPSAAALPGGMASPARPPWPWG